MKRMFDLTGHVSLVTGGNAGLGLAMAKGLAKCGASIAIWSRNEERNKQAVELLTGMGVDAASFGCDVTNSVAVDAAMAETIERFGRLDSCFANAGGAGVRGAFLDLDTKDWQKTIDLNLQSVVSTFRAAAREMVKSGNGGKLVVTSSVAALMGIPGGGYSTTKAAVAGLVRSLAVELAPAGIQANAIMPGFIETEMSLDTPQAFQDACLRRSPSGKIGQLEDMEGIAVFLASKESRFLTGQSIVLDGGHTIFPM
jgi:NAD(P)-dependent dehydrogenase (short-subunit alcohol dehydrogenase family)